MRHLSTTLVCAAGLLAAAATFAQAPPPLNLKLPAAGEPTTAGTSAVPPANAAPSPTAAPGVYYGDTSGRMGNVVADAPSTPPCDDSTYNQPQVHGSVGVGVMSGSRIGTGNYESGTVNISKRYGSCDEPSGRASMSISVGQGHFGPRGRW
jgi:hypothetical protein